MLPPSTIRTLLTALVTAIALLAATLMVRMDLQDARGPQSDAPSAESLHPFADFDFARLQWHVMRGGGPTTLTPIARPQRVVPVRVMHVRQYRPGGHRVFRTRAAGLRPMAIVLHATGSGERGSEFRSVEALGRYFARRTARTSAHYGVGRDGRVARYVDETHSAFHARTWNDISIGIELLNDNSGHQSYPPAQLLAAARLVQEVAARHHIPLEGLVRHRTIQPSDRRDPVGFPWHAWRAGLLTPQ